jgi:NAD(P)H-dependent FMN reductase
MIVILSGTNRISSNTNRVALLVQSIYDQLGIENDIIDLTKLPAEVFCPTIYANKPESLNHFTRPITQAKGVVIVTPEYNGSFPGILKYFIDLLPMPESFISKPVCFIGLSAGKWGAFRAVEQLRQILLANGAFIFPKPVLIPEIDLQLKSNDQHISTEFVTKITQQASDFVEFVKSIEGYILTKS